jgi:putative transposase
MHKSYKFRLEPTDKQAKALAYIAGSCRFVYNYFLSIQKKLYEKRKATGDENIKFLTYPETSRILTQLKQEEETKWLKNPSSHVLQQTLIDLNKAIINWLRRKTGFPRFKKKGVHDSFRIPLPPKLDDNTNKVYVPKIGWVKFRKSRDIKGITRSFTISREGEHWYISILTKQKEEQLLHPNFNTCVGIDLGVKHFATLSTGIHIDLPDFSKLYKQLASTQKQYSHKKKGSKNQRKVGARMAKIHRKIRNKRLDCLHKVSTAIAKRYGTVVMEDLKIINMMKSAKGTKEKPGKNVKAKSGLNRSIARQGWGIFCNLLDYKLKFLGGELRLVSPHYTSQTCPRCLRRDPRNRKSQSVFECVDCGHVDNADVNAARNILRIGMIHGVSPCDDEIIFVTQKLSGWGTPVAPGK